MGRHSYELTYQEMLTKYKEGVKKTSVVTIACGNKLYLRIFGKKREAYWYFRDEKENFKKFGQFPKLSLSMARQELLKILETPSILPSENKKPISFGHFATKWLVTKESCVRFDNIRKSVDYLKPIFDQDIRELKITQVKEAILGQEITPYKTQEVLGVLNNIMNLAVEEEVIPSHNFYILKKSPSFPKHIKGAGYKWQPVSNFKELFSRFENISFLLQRYYLLLCLLCIRPGECRQLQFDFLNSKNKCIEIPGSIMKVKRATPFRIPLTPQIETLWFNIKSASKSTHFLFPKVRQDAPMVERDIAVPFSLNAGDLAQPHGFRKSARTWFADQGVPYDIAAMCLDHKLNLGADHAYQKSDMLELRRPIMRKWSSEVEKNLPNIMKLHLH